MRVVMPQIEPNLINKLDAVAPQPPSSQDRPQRCLPSGVIFCLCLFI